MEKGIVGVRNLSSLKAIRSRITMQLIQSIEKDKCLRIIIFC